jgi:hypothetical protein
MNAPKKFTKKPVTIEAILWTGNNLKEVINFTGKHPKWDKWFSSWEEYEERVKNDGGIFKIITLEGTMEASIGDYIIKGVKGEFYPCKPDIFHLTYSEEQALVDGLDLEDLTKKLDAALEKETPESLRKWLDEKRNKLTHVDVEKEAEKHFDIDYPKELGENDSEFVGSLWDIYLKGFTAGFSHRKGDAVEFVEWFDINVDLFVSYDTAYMGYKGVSHRINELYQQFKKQQS